MPQAEAETRGLGAVCCVQERVWGRKIGLAADIHTSEDSTKNLNNGFLVENWKLQLHGGHITA